MFKTIRTQLGALVIALAFGFAMTTAQAEEHPAQVMVEEAITAMLMVFKEEGDRLKAEPEYLQAKVDELIVPSLDFVTMTRLAVSKFWNRADAQQQEQLVTEFRTLLLNAYTNALTEYSGETFEFEPFRAGKRDDRAQVRSSFIPSVGDSVPVIYKLRDKGGWSIYDIEVNDVSLVIGYRSAFSSEIEKGGIDGLIKLLKERNGTS